MAETAAARIHLSPPHMSGRELPYVQEAFATNWVAPVGPHIDAFEREFAALVGAEHAVAVSSGTAALHLSLILAGVGPGDEVLVSDFTFAASVNPIVYQRASPVLVDSEPRSWNIDPDLVADALRRRAARGKMPKALVATHIYGQSADIAPIVELCADHGVALIEDATESLGSTYHGRAPGTFGRTGCFSFNGNKIITTSGGGMLVTADAVLAAGARKLATQARDPAPHYEHTEIGFNYRLSNLLAAVGRGQLAVLEERVQARRVTFAHYRATLGQLPGLAFQPEAAWGRHTRWLSCLTLDPAIARCDREALRLALDAENIESRPLWKPMHMQPVFAECEVVGGAVSDELFARGLCIPSGSNLTLDDRERVIAAIRAAAA